jgi:hypothetical protein
VDTQEKVRENRARRAAERQGYAIHKHRSRDPRHRLYGRWRTMQIDGGEWLTDEDGAVAWSTLDEIEEWLTVNDKFVWQPGDIQWVEEEGPKARKRRLHLDLAVFISPPNGANPRGVVHLSGHGLHIHVNDNQPVPQERLRAMVAAHERSTQ